MTNIDAIKTRFSGVFGGVDLKVTIKVSPVPLISLFAQAKKNSSPKQIFTFQSEISVLAVSEKN